MKIYTRKGDGGDTTLLGGGRTRKDDLRVEAYGGVDELNSAIGVAIAHIGKEGELASALREVQHRLFRLGAELADPEGKSRTQPLGSKEVEALERAIDSYDRKLPQLAQFILPGGALAGACLHNARSVCRRTERAVVRLASSNQKVPADATRYLNRLSDFLFVLARAANQDASVPEEKWDPET